MSKNDSNTELVMGEIIAACRKRAVKEAREEKAKLKRKAASLSKEIAKLKAEVKKLKEGERSLEVREHKVAEGWRDLQVVGRRVMRSAQKLESFRQHKIGSHVWNGAGWKQMQREASALKNVRKLVK